MKRILASGLLGLSLVAANAALATEGEDLMKSKGCVACHNLDGRLVGPNYKSVAAKRADDADAQAILVEHIQKGSRGVYGPIPMPANRNVSDEEANILAEWILSLNE